MVPQSFVGGFVIGGWGAYATWPLVRLTLDENGGTIGPSARVLSIFIPTFTFVWPDVVRCDVARRGIQFRFRHRLASHQRWGPWARGFAALRPRQITFGCRGRYWDALWQAIPTNLWPKAQWHPPGDDAPMCT